MRSGHVSGKMRAQHAWRCGGHLPATAAKCQRRKFPLASLTIAVADRKATVIQSTQNVFLYNSLRLTPERKCDNCLQGAAEATGVRSMQDRRLLPQGLPGAHST